jgi:hypothetical protein
MRGVKRCHACANRAIGSGSLESAIRRVINLRLKAAGTFWTKEMGECFLFLRSQLLSERWEVILDNLTQQPQSSFIV